MKLCSASPDTRTIGAVRKLTGRRTVSINRSSHFRVQRTTVRLGKVIFLAADVSNDRIRVMAFKKAELSDELIVRMVEMDGRPPRMFVSPFPRRSGGARSKRPGATGRTSEHRQRRIGNFIRGLSTAHFRD